jgi:phosphatidylglycerophosphatase A
VGVWLCGKTAKDLGVHDHPGIVWDEFCGYWFTMLAAPDGWFWIFLLNYTNIVNNKLFRI